MDIALLLSGIIGLGILAQWVAWYLKQPSILFLLLIGILVGPVFNFFHPDEVLGDLLFPFISLGVAVILFEGALTLEFEEIKQNNRVVRRLVSVGMLITISVLSFASYFLFDMDWRIALLFGSLVCVTGPTVIVPLLRSVRPTTTISNILKWEGIIIDPIGAIAVVLVYEYIISGGESNEITTFLKIFFIAVILGMVGAWVLAKLIKKHLIPEYLRNVFVLSYVLLLFSISNHFAHESGLLTVTILGVALANWKNFPKEHILEVKESLTVLLISTLFIILAARMNLHDLYDVGISGIILLLIAMFIARPLAIWASSMGSNLSINEKLMISWVGPRGIVAAAISSLFSIRLQDSGIQGVELLVPLVFTIIIGTVLIQGLGAKSVAKMLGVRKVADSGVLIVGASPAALLIASSLKDLGIEAIVASSHYGDIAKARMMGLRTYYGSPISTHADNNLDLIGIGYLFAMSTDKEMNSLSEIHYRHEFKNENIFRLRLSDENNQNTRSDKQDTYKSNWLFNDDVTYAKLASLVSKDARIKVTNITENYTYDQYKEDNKQFIPLYSVDQNNIIHILNSKNKAVLSERRDDLAFFAKHVDKNVITRLEEFVNSDFAQIDYTDAIDVLLKSGKTFEFPVSWGIDLSSEHERYLAEEHFKSPVVVKNYPKDIKAFYMRLNDDGKTVAAMDVLAPGIGEIIGGSQREERLDVLDKRMAEMGLNPEDYWWYRDLRKYGTVPHSGFGLGFERLIVYVTGVQNIRDVIPFPRSPRNANF